MLVLVENCQAVIKAKAEKMRKPDIPPVKLMQKIFIDGLQDSKKVNENGLPDPNLNLMQKINMKNGEHIETEL